MPPSRISVPAPPDAAAAETSPGAPPRRVAVPPEPHDRFRVWSNLLLAVVVCLPPLLINLGTADVKSGPEAASLLTSRETWRRQHAGQPLAWMIPSANGEQVIDTPPMTTWLHMAAWWGLDPATADADALVWRARGVSVAMGLLALMATYWAGISIGGVRVARLAAMALGTTLLFIYHARVASSDVVLLGWAALAIAAGLWAMRPLRASSGVGRRVSGWLIAGLAMGGTVMTTGAIAMLFVLPPLAAAITLTPRRRVDNTIGLLFAVILGTIVTAPWYLYVLEQTPGAWDQLFGQYGPPDDLFLLTWSHSQALVLLSPWLVWLVGALCQPFLRASGDRRRPLLIPWFWFVLLAITLSIPASRHPRYLVPILPAAALMIGQLWSYHTRLASARQQDPGINLLRVPHWLLIGFVSILGPMFIAFQPQLIDAGRLDRLELPGLSWPVALGLGVVLLGIAMLGIHWHFHWRPRLAAYATVAWMLIATTVCFHAYAHSHHNVNPHHAGAQRIARALTGQPLVYLQRGEAGGKPDLSLPFYLDRVIPPVTPEQLRGLTEHKSGAAVIARRGSADAQRMRAHGFTKSLDLTGDAQRGLRLYVAPPPPPASTAGRPPL